MSSRAPEPVASMMVPPLPEAKLAPQPSVATPTPATGPNEPARSSPLLFITKPDAPSSPTTSSRPTSPVQPSGPPSATRTSEPAPTPIQVPSILLTDDRGHHRLPDFNSATVLTPAQPLPTMPAILFSGDRVLDTVLPLETPPGILPSDPSTPALWLGALDPHSLCAQWEIPNKQRDALASEAPGGALQLRVLTDLPTSLCVSTETLDPSMQTAFVSVPVADTPYRAELGIRSREGHWSVLAASTPTVTHAETTALDTSYHEARWFSPERRPSAPVSETIAVINPSDGIQEFSTEWTNQPSVQPTLPTDPPSIANARRLIRSSVGDTWTESTSSHSLSRSSSLEEWAEENAIRDNAFSANPTSSIPSSEALLKPLEALDQAFADSPTSRSDQPPSPGRKFWFKINAEVTLYGSTEPNATVFIGSQKVTLRPDGTFTFRFALPNGTFPLPVVAIAADGSDGRAATVTLSRQTEFSGEVGVHPQDSTLRPPLPQNAV